MTDHTHIPPHLLLPQDKVKVRDTETGDEMIVHASDFKHAASVDPKRFVLADLPAEEVPPDADTTTNEAPRPHHRGHRSHR